MSYTFNIEVFHKNISIGLIEDFFSLDTSLNERTTNTLAERARGDKEWDYYSVTCFEENEDGTYTQKNIVEVNNKTDVLTVTVIDNSAAPAWHRNFIDAVKAWAEGRNAKPKNTTITQQYSDAMELNLNIEITEIQTRPITVHSFCYTWLTAKDRTAFNLKY